MFAGSFKQMPFSEVVRLLSSSHQTGALNIKEEGTEVLIGQLFMQMGQLIDAVQGSHNGLDAIQELCRWIEADFVFDATAESSRQSLVAYPTEKLIEKIKLRTDELKAIKDSMPKPEDVPLYQSGMDASSLNVTPDELALLLQCSGEKTVTQIAQDSAKTADQISNSLARFRHAGIITLQSLPATGAGTTPADQGNAPQPKDSGKPVRYWRGHIVE
ncbi:MAG: DUF4388 domain-containing protein [Verrucomicrobiota bacterium]